MILCHDLELNLGHVKILKKMACHVMCGPALRHEEKNINSLKKVKTQNLLISRQLITCFNRWPKCG